MNSNQQNINQTLAREITPQVQQQYEIYKQQVRKLRQEFELIKKDWTRIAKIIQKMKNENLINNHVSSLLEQTSGYKLHRGRVSNTEADLKEVTIFFQKLEKLSQESLPLIFNIRKLLTGQEFVLYLEEKGKIYSFSLEDIAQHMGSLMSVYGLNTDTMINNMTSSTKSLSKAFTKLGFSLKKLETDKEKRIKNFKKYQEFVTYHITKNKKNILANRQFEAAVYLWTRNNNVNFNDTAQRHSLHRLLGNYIAKGGTSDNIAMYKLGDAVQKNAKQDFTNIELKMSSGYISLTMIINGIKQLDDAFQKSGKQLQTALIKVFTANNSKLSNPIEKEAQKNIEKMIKETLKQLDNK